MEPMGMALNKDWVLLADYCDKSLMRSIWMFEASKAVGMNYTPDYRHVDLYLNNEYQGTYLMTELIEEGSKKVNVEDDGFIIECDGHYLEEPCYFITEPFSMLKTDDIHPPKSVISVHFFCLTCLMALQI